MKLQSYWKKCELNFETVSFKDIFQVKLKKCVLLENNVSYIVNAVSVVWNFAVLKWTSFKFSASIYTETLYECLNFSESQDIYQNKGFEP